MNKNQQQQQINESINNVFDSLTNRVRNLLNNEEILMLKESSDQNEFDNCQCNNFDRINDQIIIQSSNGGHEIFEEDYITKYYNYQISLNFDNEFDDLTEYYPIESKSFAKILPSKLNYHQISEIIKYNKDFINKQINHLNLLNNKLINIENYLLKSSGNNNEKIFKNHHKHNRNYSDRSNVIVNNEKLMKKQHRKIHSFYLQNFELDFADKCLDTKISKNNNKNTKKINNQSKHGKQIEFLNSLKQESVEFNYDNDEMDDEMINKSVQTSFIQNSNESGNEVSTKTINNSSLSWFIEFNNNDGQDEQEYWILDSQTYNLIEIFDKHKKNFKRQSLIRSRRINDNSRLRRETADQRKNEIVQVFLLTKNGDSKNRFEKQVINRPLSPITRRVFTHRQMRRQTEKILKNSSDLKNNRHNENENDLRKRRMMAQIFKEKLKDNAVRGRLNWPITSHAIAD